MNQYDWKSFLKDFNQKVLHNVSHSFIPPGRLESGWLGYPPASEEQILSTEKRLGAKLPLSYREFLKTTNGWSPINCFIYRLFSVEEIGWFNTRNQDWINIWNDGYEEIPDEEYFVYGDKQDTTTLRTEYMQTTLEISDLGDGAIILLNPNILTPKGEWETWFLANWYPGAARYRSFWELMQDELQFEYDV